MILKKTIIPALLCFPLLAAAQTTVSFEMADYRSIGVYDTWEESPFRTGALRGNVAVVENHLAGKDNALGYAPNSTGKILAVQRSRFGSNTFGVRIDLKETFELTKDTKYAHVFIHKPTEGRVMLIGLGKRRERAGQSSETEQFWTLSTTKITPNGWCDAVFPIKGAGNIDIHSLVVVPDCESPHALQEAFAAYVDEIVIDNDANPRFRRGDYILNFSEDEISNKSGSFLNSITLNGSKDGNQSVEIGSISPQRLYRPLLEKSFTARAGETLTPTFSYTASWMNGYVYLDRGNDGRFEATLADNYTIPAGSDIMTYSYVETVENTEGYKSDGSKVTGNARNVLNPPAFKLPEDLAPGFYRMRFKVDWGSVDPAGRMTATNSIKQNGGVIVDMRMNIHGDFCNVNDANRNGEVLTANGEKLVKYQAPFGQPLTIKMNPENGFTYDGIRLRHGHNLAGDSLIHGTPQYEDVVIPAYLFKDDKFTIPAEYMDGDVEIEGLFVEITGETPKPAGDYALNFGKDLTITRSDRQLNRISFTTTQGGATTLNIPSGINYVYRNLTPLQVSAVSGDKVSTSIDYTGKAMHLYLYVDYSQDGQFNNTLTANGVPTISSELVSYTYYDGKNSLGQSIDGAPGSVAVNALPEFTIPSFLPAGVYRARLKVDWNNIDPAGQWTENGANKINENGGYVVDFLLNVQATSNSLDIQTVNGSINGSGTSGLPEKIPFRRALTVVPVGAAQGYEAEFLTIRHGHNIDGEQFVHGNRQWSEYRVAFSKGRSVTLPADSVNGMVRITAEFLPTETAAYKLVFADEFNEGTAPDNTFWTRCTRQNPTWKRFLSKTEEGHKLTGYIENGKFVARAIPNPLPAEGNVAMISGGIESCGKFSFKYGKIEGRLKTNPYSGNFPAFWMMPENTVKGWPYDGEIDIWEQVNTLNRSDHTIHTQWANTTADGSLCQGQGNNPPKSGSNGSTTNGNYHTFGFEWTDDLLTWYVDGQKVFSYAKLKNNANALSRGQWPFDAPFYIILNQSVGNGGYAANPDTGHTYETLFDWVRVYQKDSQITNIGNLASDRQLDYYVSPGKIRFVAPKTVKVTITTLSGRTVFRKSIQGNVDVKLQKGIYVINDNKVIVP